MARSLAQRPTSKPEVGHVFKITEKEITDNKSNIMKRGNYLVTKVRTNESGTATVVTCVGYRDKPQVIVAGDWDKPVYEVVLPIAGVTVAEDAKFTMLEVQLVGEMTVRAFSGIEFTE